MVCVVFLALEEMRFASFAALMSSTVASEGIFFGCKDEFNCLSLNFSKSGKVDVEYLYSFTLDRNIMEEEEEVVARPVVFTFEDVVFTKEQSGIELSFDDSYQGIMYHLGVGKAVTVKGGFIRDLSGLYEFKKGMLKSKKFNLKRVDKAVNWAEYLLGKGVVVASFSEWDETLVAEIGVWNELDSMESDAGTALLESVQ